MALPARITSYSTSAGLNTSSLKALTISVSHTSKMGLVRTTRLPASALVVRWTNRLSCQSSSGAVGPSYSSIAWAMTTMPALTWGPFFKVFAARKRVALIASRGITGRPPKRYRLPYHSSRPTSSRSASVFLRLPVIFLIAWDHWLSGSLSCPLCIKRGATDVSRNCCTCFKGHLLVRRGELLRHPGGRDLLRWWHGGTCRHKFLCRDGS